MTDLEEQQAQAAIDDIATRRGVIYQEYRGAIDPPPEFFGRLRALDREERVWRAKLAQHDAPTPAYLPPWGRELWTTVETLRLDVWAFRDERRRERLLDMAERDRARRDLYRWLFATTTLIAVLVSIIELLR